MSDARCLIASSRGGLYQAEILDILEEMGYCDNLKVTVLPWLRLRQHLGSLLWDSADGRVRFAHRHLQDLTLYTLLSELLTLPVVSGQWVFIIMSRIVQFKNLIIIIIVYKKERKEMIDPK